MFLLEVKSTFGPLDNPQDNCNEALSCKGFYKLGSCIKYLKNRDFADTLNLTFQHPLYDDYEACNWKETFEFDRPEVNAERYGSMIRLERSKTLEN